MKKIIALALAVCLCLSLVPAAVAYSTPDFVDVPAGNWAYDAVMEMADRGIIQGTGDRMFSPNATATAEQFITLVGRIVFPDVKADGKDWSGPYVAEARANGFLTGTTITDGTLKNAITRYDMAVVLRAAAKYMGAQEMPVQPYEVGDYGTIPNMYTEAVLAVYGSKLITGDDNRNFNGANPMRRNELAMVMSRLKALKENRDAIDEVNREYLSEIVSYNARIGLESINRVMGKPAYDTSEFYPGVSVTLCHTPDGGKTSTVIGTSVSSGINGEATFSFEGPRGWGSILRPKNSGFYILAETTSKDGQRLVSNALRTDDKAFTELFGLNEVEKEGDVSRIFVELTPPTGVKVKLNFHGGVGADDIRDGAGMALGIAGMTVRLYLKNGVLLGEEVTDEQGLFSMDFEVDALDNAFDPRVEQYYYTADGIVNGVHYENTSIYSDGVLRLRSLNYLGANPDSPEGCGITAFRA